MSRPQENFAAQRDDVVLLIRVSDSRRTVTLGIVTSVTRTGLVKEWDEPIFTDSEPRPLKLRTARRDEVQIASQRVVDAERAMAAYRRHTWPGDDIIKPFASIGEAREFLRPFRIP